MARYQGIVTTPKPIEEVFAYVADLSNSDEWDPSIERARTKAGQPLQVGAEFEVEVSGPLGRTSEMTYRTLEVDPPRRAVLCAETPTLVSRDTLTFHERLDGGTELTYEANLEPKGVLKIADPVLNLVFKRYGERAREGLERRLNA
jgi:uncharacterized protein YndB with AHSA1/START domain